MNGLKTWFKVLALMTVCLTACVSNNVEDTKIDIENIKSSALESIGTNEDSVNNIYISDSACYIQVSTYMYRFQLDNKGNIESCIKYSLEG